MMKDFMILCMLMVKRRMISLSVDEFGCKKRCLNICIQLIEVIRFELLGDDKWLLMDRK